MNYDNLTIEQRQRVMRRVRSKDTQPELLVRRYLGPSQETEKIAR